MQYLLLNGSKIVPLIQAKLERTVGLLSFGFLNPNFPVGLAGTKKIGDCFAHRNIVFIYANAFLFLAGMGFVFLSASGGRRLPLLFPLIIAKISTVLFFGLVRISLSALPVILIFQAAALTKIVPQFSGGPATELEGWPWSVYGFF